LEVLGEQAVLDWRLAKVNKQGMSKRRAYRRRERRNAQVFGRGVGDQVAELVNETDESQDVFGRVAVVQLSEEVPLGNGVRE
jgi:hypothetical protein